MRLQVKRTCGIFLTQMKVSNINEKQQNNGLSEPSVDRQNSALYGGSFTRKKHRTGYQMIIDISKESC